MSFGRPPPTLQYGCPGGGIGRRSGLKIRRAHALTSSSLVLGILTVRRGALFRGAPCRFGGSLLPAIVVTRRLPEPIEHVLRERYGAHLNVADTQYNAEDLVRALRRYEIVLCTLTDRLSEEVLGAGGFRARMLANFGVGTNHINLSGAKGAGLVVTNTPGVLTDDTADLTLLLILAAARRAFEGDRELRAGRWTGWRPTHLLGTRVSGKRLGIVGMGRIGQAVSRRASRGFGMEVRYWSRNRMPDAIEQACGALPAPSLDALIAGSDFLSLHCPATAETRHLINAQRLARFQPHAFLVNTSRGDVVDEEALLLALKSGQLAGAALDVFDGEPKVRPELLADDRIVTLPHLGSATHESRVAMGERVLANIDAFIRGVDLPDRVV